jgi:hypothetical protein
MTPLVDAGKELDAFLREHGRRYCVVGGLAVPRWGQPRSTQDVDVCLLTPLGEESEIIAELLGGFAARIDSAADFAERNRVLLIEASNKVNLDVALAWTPFEERMVGRATPFAFAPSVILPTASAEDLIVAKAFAARPQDWLDIRGIVERQNSDLDWETIVSELTPLCELKESPETLEELKRIRVEFESE